MSRSKWKIPSLNKFLLNKNNLIKTNKIWFRNKIIPSSYIGKIVYIYNGKLFKKILITREKVGYKFGEFCTTRNYTKKIDTSKKKIKK